MYDYDEWVSRLLETMPSRILTRQTLKIAAELHTSANYHCTASMFDEALHRLPSPPDRTQDVMHIIRLFAFLTKWRETHKDCDDITWSQHVTGLLASCNVTIPELNDMMSELAPEELCEAVETAFAELTGVTEPTVSASSSFSTYSSWLRTVITSGLLTKAALQTAFRWHESANYHDDAAVIAEMMETLFPQTGAMDNATMQAHVATLCHTLFKESDTPKWDDAISDRDLNEMFTRFYPEEICEAVERVQRKIQ